MTLATQEQMSSSQFLNGSNEAPARQGKGPKQQKASAGNNQKGLLPKKAFPYHSIHVPKKTDFGGPKQQTSPEGTMQGGGNNQKTLAPKKFQPYHAIRVPKETDLGGNHQQSFEPAITTLMLRNIPNKYTQTVLLQEIEQLGFSNTYDFFYLPMDVHNRTNVGYAFVNFVHPASAQRCKEVFSNYKFQRYHSKKICAVCHAHLQGFEKNVKHFQQCAVMNAGDKQYRPVVRPGGAQAQSQTLELETLIADPPSFDMFNSCFIAERLPKAQPDLSPWSSVNGYANSQDMQAERLPEPLLDDVLPSLQEALSELLRQKDIAGLKKQYSYTDMPLKVEGTFSSKLSPWYSEEPRMVPQGQGKLQKPPGLLLDEAASGMTFEVDDKTPRTNHSYLGDCFGTGNGAGRALGIF
jgi:hypothetical protein